MYKQFGAILLVAGTCIGSGMIALPMVLAKLGLVPSIFLMLVIWFVMYYTSLINLELNLQAGRGLSLGGLGRHFSGIMAESIGIISLKLLSYSLLAVFIYGGASILTEAIASWQKDTYSFTVIATGYSLVGMLVLLLPIKLIDYFNRFLFVGLLIVVAILIAGLSMTMQFSELPLFSDQYMQVSVWLTLLPVVFTSFGFQVIFHTLTNYCQGNSRMLKRAFFWGSLIPAIIYIIWTSSLLSIIYQDNKEFYNKMIEGKAEVGELIEHLSEIAKGQSVQLLIWWISLLAIATSVIGVGVGLMDSLKGMLAPKINNKGLLALTAVALTIGPAYLVVIFVPNAFITVLGFAGMILAIIAILFPVYLLSQIKKEQLYYSELKIKPLIYFSTFIGVAVIGSEIFNLFFRV